MGHPPFLPAPLTHMSPTLSSRLAGMLQGSFIAESISLGVHWIYDPALLLKNMVA